MALSPLTSLDAGASARAKINAGFTRADAAHDRVDNLSDRIGQTNSGLAATNAALAAQQGDLDAIELSLAPYLDLVGGAPDRAGDARTLFTRIMSGSPKARAAMDKGSVQNGGELGQVLRIAGEDTDPATGYIDVAPRRAYYVRPGRAYIVQYAFARFANPTDPEQNAVELRLQNLGSTFGQVSNIRLGDAYAPTVENGSFFVDALIGKAGAPGELQYIIPATARYVVPFFRIYGNGQQTDIGGVRLYDVSDALAGGADVASILARVKKLEDGQSVGVIYAASWTDLAAREGKVSGAGAETPDSDTGSHTDPVTGTTVPNAGRYSWSTSPVGWRWIAPTTASIVAGTTAAGIGALTKARSDYRPGDLIGSWTSQVQIHDATAVPLAEGQAYSLVDGADGSRVLRIAGGVTAGAGPIHCDQVTADKIYEFRFVGRRIADGASPTILLRLYGFNASKAAVTAATILSISLTVADGLKEFPVRLTGAQILALIPGAVKFRMYASVGSTNGQLEISSITRTVVTDLALAFAGAPTAPTVPPNGRFPYYDPADGLVHGADFSLLQTLLGGASAGTIATLAAVMGTKVSRYAPPIVRNIVRPHILGALGAGQVLTLNPGRWATNVDLQIQWRANGLPIGGATGLTYTRTTDTANSVITAVVEAQSAVASAALIAYTTLPMPSIIASIVMMGDSIVAGQGAGDEANRSLNKLAAYYGTTDFINQGKSGTVLQNSADADGGPKTNNGRDRYLADLLGANKKELVGIAYGFNDARYVANPSEFNVLAYINDYREIVSGLLAGGYPRNRIFIVTPHWISDVGLQAGSPGFFGQTRAAFLAYVDASKQIALEFGVYWADSYSALKAAAERGEAVIGGDNIHPTPLGYDYIYRAILAAVKFADPELPSLPIVLDYFFNDEGQILTQHAAELGMSWERQPGYAPTIDAQMVNNRLFNPATNAVYRNLADMRGADYFVECDLSLISTTSANIGIIGRAHATLNSFYFANYNRAAGEFGLYKVVDGVGTTQLGSYVDTFLAGTRTLRLSMNGTSISMAVDGVVRVAVTDAAITGAGFAGIRFGTPGSKTGGIHMSRFQTGNSKLVLDDAFSGVDGASIVGYSPLVGGQYQNQTGFNPANPPLFLNGRIYAPSGATLMRNLAAPPSADYYVEAVFDFVGVRSDDVGVIGRASATAETLYFARWRLGEWTIWSDVNGTQKSISGPYADAWDSGSRRVRLTMKGTSISLQVEGLTVISIVDGTVPGPGFGGFRVGTSQTTTTGRHLTSLVLSGL